MDLAAGGRRSLGPPADAGGRWGMRFGAMRSAGCSHFTDGLIVELDELDAAKTAAADCLWSGSASESEE